MQKLQSRYQSTYCDLRNMAIDFVAIYAIIATNFITIVDFQLSPVILAVINFATYDKIFDLQ
jgi:hypothetical protein